MGATVQTGGSKKQPPVDHDASRASTRESAEHASLHSVSHYSLASSGRASLPCVDTQPHLQEHEELFAQINDEEACAEEAAAVPEAPEQGMEAMPVEVRPPPHEARAERSCLVSRTGTLICVLKAPDPKGIWTESGLKRTTLYPHRRSTLTQPWDPGPTQSPTPWR